MTADEVTGPAHLAAFGAICRSGVMMSFGSRESAIAAVAPASLCDPQSDSHGRVVRAGPRVMPYSSARSALPLRRRIERASQECNEASSTRCPQERLPIDTLLDRSWRRRPVYGFLVRKDLIGIHKRHKPPFYSFESVMIVGTRMATFVASASTLRYTCYRCNLNPSSDDCFDPLRMCDHRRTVKLNDLGVSRSS